MNAVEPVKVGRDLAFSDADFRSLAELARRDYGLNLSETKKPLVYSRLSKRLAHRGLNRFSDYLSLISRDEEEEERLELISALTTNVTAFFRENHHFQTLRDQCIPELKDKTSNRKRARIWSAGCSSGQEPYSIAMTLLDTWPDAQRKDVRILATDIDPKIVKKARAGVYPKSDTDAVPNQIRKKFMDINGDEASMKENLRGLIAFAEINLMADWPFTGPFDAIFCRNVAIYFDQSTQQRLWQRFVSLLEPGGFLFIGHSERVSGTALADLDTIGITSYRKK